VNNEIFVGNVHERAVATDILPVEYIPTTESAATNLHANADQCVLPPPALNQNIDFGEGHLTWFSIRASTRFL